MHTRHTLYFAAAMAMATASLATPLAAAHASLTGSSPQAGATVATAPKEIMLTFNEKVEAVFSTMSLLGDGGKPVTTDKAIVDASNPAVLRMAVPVLSAGAYTVSWAVVGHDGHRRHGAFKFTVK